MDDEFLDQLEEMLIASDVGVKTTVKIIDLVEKYVAKNKYLNEDELKDILKNQIISLLVLVIVVLLLVLIICYFICWCEWCW